MFFIFISSYYVPIYVSVYPVFYLSIYLSLTLLCTYTVQVYCLLKMVGPRATWSTCGRTTDPSRSRATSPCPGASSSAATAMSTATLSQQQVRMYLVHYTSTVALQHIKGYGGYPTVQSTCTITVVVTRNAPRENQCCLCTTVHLHSLQQHFTV